MRTIAQILFFVLVIRPFLLLFIGLRVHGREHLPSGPFLLVANHSSHLDTVALLSLFPISRLARVRPVAAADYFERNAVIGWFSHTFFNILAISRRKIGTSTNPLDAMEQALNAGESLILFPEGTRGSAGAPVKFRAGAAHLIERIPNLTVVPAYLWNMGRSLPKGAYIPVPFFCEVCIGEPLTFSGNRHEVLAALEKAVIDLAPPPSTRESQ